MRYVERDANGQIKGDYAWPQPGYAEESISENAAEFIAWRAKQGQKVVSLFDLVVAYIAAKPDAPAGLKAGAGTP